MNLSVLLDHFAVVLIVFAVITALIERFMRKRRKPLSEDSSMLLAYYTQDAELMHAAELEVEDLSYNVMAASDRSSAVAPVSIYIVNLPFTSRVHLLGVPTSEMAQLNPSGWGSIMEPVLLEGDFPNDFSLFAVKGQGAQARYVLDPKAMVTVIDTCERISWELINDELIFVTHTGTIDSEMIANFVREIRPAVEIPAGLDKPHLLPQYKRFRPKDLNCPLCQAVMVRKPHWYECSEGHGRLISGKFLLAVSRGEMELPHPQQPSPRHHGVLVCPFCKHQMEQVDYKGRVPIDSCAYCPYRWLDASELSKVVM